MKTGDAVQIECTGRRVEGTVILASENGASLVLAFDAILDGHAGMMPVLRGEDGSYRAVMTGTTVKLIGLPPR